MHLKLLLLFASSIALTLVAGQQGATKSGSRGPIGAGTKSGPGEIKRIAPVNSGQSVKSQQVPPASVRQQEQPPVGTKTKQRNVAPSVAKPATGGSKTASKFQSRILRSTEANQEQTSALVEQQQQQQQSDAGEQRHFGGSIDAWNPHNLMPTFTDLEQGDDMIALASDNEPAMMGGEQPQQQVKVLPQVNRSALMNSYRGASDKEMGEKESSGTQAGPANKQRPAQATPVAAVDDYYTDEDEEDDDSLLPVPSSGLKRSKQNNGYQVEDENTKSQMKKIMAEQRGQGQQQANNKSDLIPVGPGEGGAWQPTAPVVEAAAAATTQVDNQAEANSTQSRSPAKRPVGADRLLGLFGGRESIGSSLTKTDMAIEYLKNILKSKQQVKQQVGVSNSTDSGEQISMREPGDLEKKLKSSQSFYPLPTQLREQQVAQQQQNETIQKATSNFTQLQQQQQQKQDQLTKPRYQDFSSEAKFSISDVKRQQEQEQRFAPLQSTLGPLYPVTAATTTTTTTKTRVTTPPAQYSTFAPQPTNKSPLFKDQEPSYGQEFGSFVSLPNGTPLGGDYLESLDDFPRGLVSQQQRREKQKLESDAKAEQAGGEPLSAMASELVSGPHYLPLQESHALFQQHPPPQPLANQQTRYPKLNQPLKQPPMIPSAIPQFAPLSQQPIHPLPKITPEITKTEIPASFPVKSRQNFELEQTSLGETKAAPGSFKGQAQVREQQLTQGGPPRSPAAILLEAGNKTVPVQQQVPLREPALATKTTSIEQMIDEELRQMAKIEQQQVPNVGGKSLAYLPDGNQQAAEIANFQHQQQQQQQQHQQQIVAGPMISSKLYNNEREQSMPPTHQLPQHHHHHYHHHHNQQPQQQQLQQQQHSQHQPVEHPEPANYGQGGSIHQAEHSHDQPAGQQLEEPLVRHQPPQNEYERQPRHYHQQSERQQQIPNHEKDAIHHQQYNNNNNHQQQQHRYQTPQPQQQQPYNQRAPPKSRPPKIVSYNYFESPNEPSDGESAYGHQQQQKQQQQQHPHETNFQFGDTLLSSTGQVEHMLSEHELEAIQKQFMTAEHPVVPLADNQQQPQQASAYNEPVQQQQHQQHQQVAAHAQQALEQDLSNLLANHKSGGNISPDFLQKLNSHQQQEAEYLKEGASSIDESTVAKQTVDQSSPIGKSDYASPFENQPDMKLTHHVRSVPSQDQVQFGNKSQLNDKKKSLIVYLNHPRPNDMSKAVDSSEDNLAQLISEQTTGDPFVSAKEFDSHGLSKDTKHLDVSSLRGLGVEAKGVPDKDGLSVVVIGDAYKYKKIVLLISSKSGGLKFIPMVKDMKKK